MKKKKNIIILLLISITLVFIAITIIKYSIKAPDEVKLHPEINRMLEYLKIDKCKITELRDINEIKTVELSFEPVSQNEIDKCISKQLEMRSSFQTNHSLKKVTENDCVNFSIIKYDGETKTYSSDDEYLCLNNDSSFIAQSLIDHLKGETFEVFENNNEHIYRYSITIKDIGTITTPELTDSFVKQHVQEESVSDYITKIKNSLENEHKVISIMKAQDKVLQNIIDKCTFELDQKQVTDYSMTILNSYVEEAYLYDKDLKTYYTENLHMSEKEFFDNCYKKGEEYIKKILVVGAIAEYKNYSIDNTKLLESSNLKELPNDDESYTYLEYNYLTKMVTVPYITNYDR